VPLVSVAISQRTSGNVSNDNSAKNAYQTAEGSTALGPFIGLSSTKGCFVGFETVGTVYPSTYTGQIISHRTTIQDKTYTGSTFTGGLTNDGDTSEAAGRDDDPQSGGSGGKVYDLDAPGPVPIATGNILRYRGNFSTFASTPDGTVLSYGYNFWVRSSCTKTSGGVVQFVNDVPGDNQIGSGSAALTWNLQ
jgi:hypothetical protein